MGYEDAVTKDYIADADVFADAFNYFLYGGEQVIRPEKLHEIDPALIQVPYGADGKEETVQRYRDVLKYVEAREDGRAAYLLLGIENQSEIHYAMPVKVMGYDALQYAKQVDAVAKTHRSRRDWKKRGSGEFLSGFYREDRLVPVITLVIFFSDRKWDGPLCLKEMFEQDENLPMEYVQDYRIHLITPESLAEEELKKFHSSLREVMAFLKYSRNKQKMDELITDNRRFSRIDRKAWNVLDKCTKLNLNLPEEREEESVNMCQAWDDMKKEIEEKTEQRINKEWEQKTQKEWAQKQDEMIIHAINMLRALNQSKETALTQLTLQFALPRQTAEEYLRRFWR